jgi:hypothetical protein
MNAKGDSKAARVDGLLPDHTTPKNVLLLGRSLGIGLPIQTHMVLDALILSRSPFSYQW